MTRVDIPAIGREYHLSRRDGGDVQAARFLRYEDGSGFVEVDGAHITFELDQTAWRRYWEKLMLEGYEDSAEK